MRVVCVLGVWLAVSEAIMISGRSADNSSAANNNVETADQLIPQESHARSTFYSEYYPDEHGVSEQGYNFEPPHHPYPPQHYNHPPPHYGHDTALKALLLPLAGVALLGAAAVFASNPILLQLGVVSGRRRRRELRRGGPAAQRVQDVLLLEKYVSQLPQDDLAREERRLLANFLTCSGVSSSTCLERLACEVFQPGASISLAERRVMDIIIHEVINNEFISERIKADIIKARKAGQVGEQCGQLPCEELDKHSRVDIKEEERVEYIAN